jgi:hypothetical protein
MKGLRWKWVLPGLQLTFAAFCLFYGPHQFRLRARRDGVAGDNNVLEYSAQNAPAPIERVSKAMNFPALVLAYPVKERDNAIYFHNSDYALVWISPKEIGFFIGIALFWYWVGTRFDRRMRGSGAAKPRSWSLSITELGCGLLFGILTGAYALRMLIETGQFRPERQIAVCGIIWSAILIAYFTSRLTREWPQTTSTAPRPPTAT